MSDTPGTRHDGSWSAPSEGTRHDATSAGSGGPAGRGAPAGGAYTGTIQLPPGLAERFELMRPVDTAGAEAWVVVARDRRDGVEYGIKLYKDGYSPESSTIARLADVHEEHVVTVQEHNWERGIYYEVMEWCRHGSLRDLMDRRVEVDLHQFVSELANALAAIHAVDVIHRDIKPENILVRKLDRLDLVLADFGIVRSRTDDIRFTRVGGTAAYAPPEFESGAISTAFDWWGVGMIVLEYVTGRHPFSVLGEMLDDRRIALLLSQQTVDVSAVVDSRTRLLCAGLLQRSVEDRWTHQQVAEWLDGGHPEVRSGGSAGLAFRLVTAPTVWFAGHEHSTVDELATTFSRSWDDAAEQLFQVQNTTLVDDLRELLIANGLDAAVAALDGHSGNPHRRLAELLAEMDPRFDSEEGRAELRRDLAGALYRIDRLPLSAQRLADRGDILHRLYESHAQAESVASIDRRVRRRRGRRRAAKVHWWREIHRRSDGDRVMSIMAEALLPTAIEVAGELAEADPVPVTAPVPMADGGVVGERGAGRRRGRRGRTVLLVFVLVVAVGGGAVWAITQRDDGSSAAPGSTAPGSSSTSSSSSTSTTLTALEESPNVWGGFPERTKVTRRPGFRGDVIEYAQLVLIVHSGAALTVDGAFGPETEQAVRNLQRFVGLGETGALDGDTWAIIDSLAVGDESFDPGRGVWGIFPVGTKPDTRMGDSGRLVEYAQLVLMTHAGADLEPDGSFGNDTATSVRDLQRFVSLPETGIVDRATWKVIDWLALSSASN